MTEQQVFDKSEKLPKPIESIEKAADEIALQVFFRMAAGDLTVGSVRSIARDVITQVRRAAIEEAVAECHDAAAKYHVAGLTDCEQVVDALADDIAALATSSAEGQGCTCFTVGSGPTCRIHDAEPQAGAGEG